MAINIKEIFLIILSKIYHFDSNISSISNSKLPIIEYYDKYISSGRRSTKSTQKYNTITRSSQRYNTSNKYNKYNNNEQLRLWRVEREKKIIRKLRKDELDARNWRDKLLSEMTLLLV
eukprot:4002_1